MTRSSRLDLRCPSPPASSPAVEPAAASVRTAHLPAILAAIQRGYSSRLAETTEAICALCEHPTGAGPVGHFDDQPICDLCLLEGSHELAMVLALVAVVRAYGSVEVASDAERREALDELGAFARVYEHFAAKSGSPRRIVPRDKLPAH